MGGVKARWINPAELRPAELDAWADLGERALEPNPFYEPAFLLPAARHIDGDGVSLLVVEDGPEWVALAPVRAPRWRGRRAPVLATWRPMYSFLGTPQVDRMRPADALGALLEAATTRAPGRLFALDWVGSDGRLVGQARLAAADLGYRVLELVSFERAALRRRPEENYQEGMRSHRRRDLQRLRRGLERVLGAELETRDRSGDGAAPDDFMHLEAAGWKGGAGTAMASSEDHARFFREACAGFRDRGSLQIISLEAGARTLAMKCNFRAGEGIFCFKIAFDEEFAKFSPGVQLEMDNVAMFHASGAAWMDSCADPGNQMINRLWPDRRRIATLALSTRDGRGRLSRRGAGLLRTLREQRGRS